MPDKLSESQESDRPLFSVIMAARDAAATIDDAIVSARAQTFEDFELIVVENGSSDGTADAAQKHAGSDRRIVVLADGPRSPGGARNLGIMRARGDWIAFLDADDAYAPQFLETLATSIRAYPDADAHVVNGRTMHRLPRTITHGPQYWFPQVIGLDDIVSMQLITGQVALRRTALVAVGCFHLQPAAEDFDLWVRFFTSRHGRWIPKRLYRYRYDRRSRCHRSERRELMLRSLISTFEVARTADPTPQALRRISRRERHYASQLEAWPYRAELEAALSAGESRGLRMDYLRARNAYGKRRNWLMGLPVMMLSPRLFARLFIDS